MCVCLGETAGDVYRWLNRRWHHMTTSFLLTRQVFFFLNCSFILVESLVKDELSLPADLKHATEERGG